MGRKRKRQNSEGLQLLRTCCWKVPHPPTPVARRAVLASSISRHAALEATLTCAHIGPTGFGQELQTLVGVTPSWSHSGLQPCIACMERRCSGISTTLLAASSTMRSLAPHGPAYLYGGWL